MAEFDPKAIDEVVKKHARALIKDLRAAGYPIDEPGVAFPATFGCTVRDPHTLNKTAEIMVLFDHPMAARKHTIGLAERAP